MVTAPAGLSAALAERYSIERELGAGGMATVYLAHDTRHGRHVAIKVLHPDLAASLGAERFLAEIRTTASLQHPHILALHDSGQAERNLYYVMPYIEGESLRTRLDREKRLPLGEALAVVRDVADALDYAHRAGIVHRDIKPENILLTGRHAVVADFGIARAVADPQSERLTQTGHVIGTPAYLSPEQVLGEPLDGRSDLYSLGCVLFEALTGELPFAGPGMAMLAQRVVEPPPSARARRAEIPAHVDRAISRVMATDPRERYASGAEFIAALDAPSGTASAATPKDERRAIVVLPFTNQSADPDNEFFTDGLTEEIISDLAGVRSLRVTSRTSAMQLKGTTKDLRTIGRELGVRYALEGSVRRAGDSLRITAQLVDAATDSQVWSGKYGGTISDVFEVQERVAREIVSALGITLTSDEDRRLSRRPIENVRAFELYLEARQEMRRYSAAAIERGDALLGRAIEIEGATPPLEALRAWGQVSRVRAGLAKGSDSLDAAAQVARRLLADGAGAPYGHAILGLIGYERGDMAAAVRHFLVALESEPNDADSLFYLGICYVGAGQSDRARSAAERLMAVDPLSPLAWLLSGIVPWWTGHAREGIPSVLRAVEMDPGNLIAHWTLGYGLALVGDVAGAAKEADVLQQLAPQLPYTVQLRALVYGMSGRQAEARRLLEGVAGLDAHQKFHLAESLAMAGDGERALQLLEEAVHGGFYPGEFLARHCPFVESLKGRPRFDAVARESIRRSREFAAASQAA
jgi:serine/threonine-protein kinase